MTLETCSTVRLRPQDVVVLTLTYGDRVDFLKQMVQGVAQDGVRRVIVLANGMQPQAMSRLSDLGTTLKSQNVQLEVHHSPTNVGSASGYGKLLKIAAADAQIAAVWLMDDDNCPVTGALAHLIAAHETIPDAALASVRVDRSYLVRAAATGFAEPPSHGQAFHVDLFRTVRRGLTRLNLLAAPKTSRGAIPDIVPITNVPYGGLFVPKARLQDVAPPREDFVIYADDYEYTNRLAAHSGLFLVGTAKIEDIETSWNATGDTAQAQVSQFDRLATMPADFRLYYSVRNALVLDRKRAQGVALFRFWINLAVFVTVGCGKAALAGNMSNARGIWRAVRDGFRGALGPASRYPLP